MLKLPSVFSDNMVLQRQAPIPFYGKANPGEKITVRLNGKFVETTAKPDGTWMVKFRPMEAGGPYSASVTADTTIEFKNVMIGEVWIASGQSNMEWIQVNADDFEQSTKETDPAVRMFTAEKVSAEDPQFDVKGAWVESKPDTVAGFSAVANAFAKEIHKVLKVPVGVIHTSWGGTPAESWASRPALNAGKSTREMVAKYLSGIGGFPEKKAAYEKELAEWNAKVRPADPGNKGFADGWAEFDAYTGNWKAVKLPNHLEVTQDDDMNGAVWYRKEIQLPEDWYGKPLKLNLGPIDDTDDTYVNGRKVGYVDEGTQYHYAVGRSYRVSPGLLRRGRNVIAVRVFDSGGQGGFMGTPLQMTLGLADGTGTPMSLAGDWVSKTEVRFDPPSQDLMNSQPQPPFGPGHPWAPGGLYNGMLAPFIPYAIRGAIWYQGESNAERAEQYRDLFPTMINDWRAKWGEGDFPFYFVQLANFTARNAEPVESDWAELREAQLMTLSLPNTGMAVTIDIGEANDIHPRNKREVGRRLALNALAQTYGKPQPHTGPMLAEVPANPKLGTIEVVFKDAVSLKTSDGGPVKGFAIAGEDKKFVWANAVIDGLTVRLSSPLVDQPKYVRYGWSNNPEVNLTDESGLPASPFRTDDFAGVTAGKK